MSLFPHYLGHADITSVNISLGMIITLTGVSGTRHLWYCGQGRARPERQRCATYVTHVCRKTVPSVENMYGNRRKCANLVSILSSLDKDKDSQNREKLLLALSCVCPSVRPSAWNSSALTGWIFVKIGIEVFF